MLSLHEILEDGLARACQSLDLLLGFEGEAFIVPIEPHVRAKIVYTLTKPASLGQDGLTITEGELVAQVVVLADVGEALANKLATALSNCFVRGASFSFVDGDLRLKQAYLGSMSKDGLRLKQTVIIPFYAFLATGD